MQTTELRDLRKTEWGSGKSASMLGAPTLPDAYRAAARLGCQETFAIVSDERARGARHVWLAEQISVGRYDLREKLGEDWTGNELNDKFALLYMQAAQHSVNWLVIEHGAVEGPAEIRDEFGRVLLKKILRMRDAYSKGPTLSEAAFVSKGVGDVVWVEVWDASGKLIAETPAKITEREEDDEGVSAALTSDDAQAAKISAQALAGGLASMGASPAAAQGVASVIARSSTSTLAFLWSGDPKAPTGSACENEDGSIKLFMAIDCRDDKEEDEDAEEGDAASTEETDEGDGEDEAATDD